MLESHHAAVGWRTIAASGLLESLNPGERKALRSVTVAAVLSTDSARALLRVVHRFVPHFVPH